MEYLICKRCSKRYPYGGGKRNGATKSHCNSCVTMLRHRRLKRRFINRLGGKCNRCGYNKCEAALCFHHMDRETKLFNLGNNFNRSMKVLEEEALKCELLCLNCHTEEHFKGD